MPGPVTFARLLTGWYLDPELELAVLILAAAYVLAVTRLRRRGVRWPLTRTCSWLAGASVALVATESGLARYSYVLTSAHMVQHLLVQLVAAPLLALGAPVTLVLRALPTGPRSIRSGLLTVIAHPVTRAITHPGVVTLAFATTPYTL